MSALRALVSEIFNFEAGILNSVVSRLPSRPTGTISKAEFAGAGMCVECNAVGLLLLRSEILNRTRPLTPRVYGLVFGGSVRLKWAACCDELLFLCSFTAFIQAVQSCIEVLMCLRTE